MFGGGGGGSGGTGTGGTVKLGAYVTSAKDIKADNNYILFNTKDDTKKEAPGTYLLKQIEDKKIWYDKNLGVWTSAKGNKYDIRRRR